MSLPDDPRGPRASIDELERELAEMRRRLESASDSERAGNQPATVDWRERYLALVEAVNSGVAVYEAVDDGRDFVFTEFNRAAARFEKTHPGEAIGRRVIEVFPGVARFGLLEVLERVWRTGVPEHHPVALYEHERITGWRENFVYRLAGGEVVAVYDDVTERKRTEDALEESIARFQSIAETALDSIFAKDQRRRYTFVNPAMTRLLGCRSEDLLGKSPEEIFDAEGAAEVRAVDDKAFAGDEVSVIRELVIGGETRVLHTIQVPMRSEGGSVLEICGIVRDITEARRAEDRVRQLNDELERRVLERTAELEAANRELEAFSYSVSHDLRTPLRSIDGFAFALEEEFGGVLGDEGVRRIHRVRNAVHRMSLLIDGLLELSRAARAEPLRRRVKLERVAQSVVTELREQQPDHPVTFSSSGSLEVDGDPLLLRTVLENLLGNAWKFTRRCERPEVRLCGETVGGELVITVRDNGVGFDMRFADTLFGTFRRLVGEEEFEGTGIGLATVKRIVERHGGRIWAEGEEGRGAAISFTLGP